MSSSDTPTLEQLCYGDLIYLRGRSHAPSDSSTGVPGIIHCSQARDNCSFLHDPPTNPTVVDPLFHNCLFRVTPCLKYESVATRRELERRPSFSGDLEEQSMIQAGIEVEEEMNSALLKKFDSTDTPTSVLYGQTIQLLHVATNRYLKANTFTALLEKDCLKLSLEEGSEYSHFRILPRFKVRHEGSPAYYDDMVNLTSPKTGYSIRVTGKPYDEDDTAQALLPGDDADPPPLPPRPRLNEANLSPTPSDLKLVKFSANPLIPANASSLLTNYSVFTLYHAESECMLAASCDPHKGTPERHIPSPHQTPLTPLTPTDPTSLHDAYLRPLATPNPASPANNSPKTLFTLDYLQPKAAHRVTWDPSTRIKHLVTGKYLYVDPTPNAQGRHALLLSLAPPTLSSSLFNLSPVSLQSQYLSATANTSMRLHHNLVTPTGTVQLNMLNAVKAKHDAGGGVVVVSQAVHFSTQQADNNAVVMMPVGGAAGENYLRKVKQSLRYLPSVRGYFERVLERGIPAKNECKVMERVLAMVVLSSDEYYEEEKFYERIEGDSYDPEAVVDDTFKCSKVWQSIAREIKLMDMLVYVATCPRFMDNVTTTFDHGTQRFVQEEMGRIKGVVRLAWKGVVCCFGNNRESEMYFARHKRWINPGIVSQIADPVGAAVAFGELVNNNAELLEGAVDGDIIKAFLDLILERGPQPRLLKFFSSICNCQGMPMISNQETVLHQLINNEANREKVLLELTQSETKRDFKLFNKEEDVPNEFLGKKERETGMHRLNVSWARIPKLADFTIDGEHSCSLLKLTSILTDSMISASPETLDQQTRDQRNLGMYLVAQIDLLAAICFGRSYNCIAKLESLLTFNLLIGIVSDTELPNVVRASFTKLLHRLWVDRYPHAPNCGRPSLPDLAWIYDTLEKKDCYQDGALPAFELGDGHPLALSDSEFMRMGSHTKFFLLRDFIEGYLASMQGVQTIGLKSKNELTQAVLAVLNDLMSFGFFANRPKIVAICSPLISVLDGRSDKMLEMNASPRVKGGDSPRIPEPTFVLDPSKSRANTVYPISNRKQETQEFFNALEERKQIGETRWETNADTIRVMACKSNMLKILGGVADMRAHYRINQLLAKFKFYVDSNTPLLDEDGEIVQPFFDDFEDLFTSDDGKAMDMASMTDCPLDTTILDLLMYQDDDLFEQAMGFVKRRYGQRRALIGFLPQVTLLDSPNIPVFGTFALLDQDLQQLRYYMRSYSVWAVHSETSPMDKSIFDSAERILTKLTEFILSTSAAASPLGAQAPNHFDGVVELAIDPKSMTPPSEFFRGRESNTLYQNVMRNMGMAREVLFHGVRMDFDIMAKLNVLNGIPMTPDQEKETALSREWILIIMKRTVFTLAAFVRGNGANQSVLFSQLPLLRSKMGVGLCIWDVVIDIFEGNQNLCEDCPADLFAQFAELLEHAKTRKEGLRLLDFFVNQVQPCHGGQAIIRNQHLCVKALTASQYGNTLSLEYRAAKSTKTELMDYNFHAKSIKVLAIAAMGRNSATGSKCQSLFPLNQLAEELVASTESEAGDSTCRMQVALLEFALYVFVDTPLLERKFAESTDMWDVLTTASNVALETWKEIGAGGLTQLQERLLCAALDLITLFFKDVFSAVELPTATILAARVQIKDSVGYMSRPVAQSPVQERGGETAWSKLARKASVTLGKPTKGAVMGRYSSVKARIERCVAALADEHEEVGTFTPRTNSPGGGAAYDDEEEESDCTAESQIQLMKDSKPAYLEIVMKALRKSKLTAAALDAKDREFVEMVEAVEKLTDPDDLEYCEAATGENMAAGDDEESKVTLRDCCVRILDVLGSKNFLFLILFLTLLGTCTTIISMVVNTVDEESHDSIERVVNSSAFNTTFTPWRTNSTTTTYTYTVNANPFLAALELVVSWIFIIELVVRISAYVYVEQEIDEFLIDPLNAVDVVVVSVDIALMISSAGSDSAGGDGGGLVKGLRILRGFRLLRLLKVARVMKIMREQVHVEKMSQKQALGDKRSVKIELSALCTRMLNFVKSHCDNPEREASCLHVLKFCVVLLRKHKDRITDGKFTAMELVEMDEDEIVKQRRATHFDKQMDLVEAGALEVLVQAFSHSTSLAIANAALELGEEVVCNGNKAGQRAFLRCLEEMDKEGRFFLAARDWIRSSTEALKEYRETLLFNEKRALGMKEEVNKVVLLFQFLKEFCEGHMADAQNLLREQKGNLKTFNIVEESVDFLAVLAKTHTVVREFGEFEANLVLPTLTMFVEMMQGPCKGNQDYVAEDRKVITVCKNILSASFNKVKDLRLKFRLYKYSMAVFAALLESRGEDQTIHQILIEQISSTLLRRRMSNLKKMRHDVVHGRCDIRLLEHSCGEGGEEALERVKEKLPLVLQHEARDLFTVTAELQCCQKSYLTLEGLVIPPHRTGRGGGGEEEEEEEGGGVVLGLLSGVGAIGGMAGRKMSETLGLGDLEKMKEGLKVAADPRNAIGGALKGVVGRAKLAGKGMNAAKGMVGLGGGLEDSIRCVEVYWNERSIKTFFTLPTVWKSLSASSKAAFLDDLDIENSETRMKGLLDAREELYEEMKYQSKLSSYPAYMYFSEYFFPIKRITYAMVLLLNANVLLSTISSLENTSILEDMWQPQGFTAHESVNVTLGLVVVCCYAVILGYLIVSYAPLAYMRSMRERHDYREEHPSEPLFDLGVLGFWVSGVVFYIAASYVHGISSYGATDAGKYASFGWMAFWSTFPFMFRAFLVAPKSKVLGMYCAVCDTLNFGALKYHLVLVLFVLMGMSKSYWFTFTLLDILTMSQTLQAVIQSITIPIKQLTQTFMLFLIVIICYTAVAFSLFGISSFVDGDDDEAPQACETLVDCFLFSLYVGMREGDMDAILGESDDASSNTQVNRMIFDLSFFIILGVLLFDMVTGVILDTFGALREEIAERSHKMGNETFVSGLTREQIDEIEGNEIVFKKVNDVDQNMWNYLFFAIYLDNKEDEALNGVESYVKECLGTGESCWLPTKTCWSIENIGAEIDDDREAIDILDCKVEEMGEMIGDKLGAVLDKLAEIEERVGGGDVE